MHQLLDRVVLLARQAKRPEGTWTGRQLRLDGTVVQTTIHHPTDSSLVASRLAGGRGRLSQDDLDAPAALTVPDLVVKVVSPNDRADRVLDKVHDWLRTGVRLLWNVDPETGTTTVYEGGHVPCVEAGELLDGGEVLLGLQLSMRDLLDAIAADMAAEPV